MTDSSINFSILFCEAFDTELGIVGQVMPERVPYIGGNVIGEDTTFGVKEFRYRQYIMLHKFMPLGEIIEQGKKCKLGYFTDDFKQDDDRYKAFHSHNMMLRADAPKTELHVHVQCKPIF